MPRPLVRHSQDRGRRGSLTAISALRLSSSHYHLKPGPHPAAWHSRRYTAPLASEPLCVEAAAHRNALPASSLGAHTAVWGD